MDIKELESFRLADAVKFHSELNPKLWIGDDLDPVVYDKLMAMAEDFMSELGIGKLKVEDITISGSNAAYSYTPHSDIDLHILVDMDKLSNDEVYRELFNAKKNEYNNSHDLKIRGIPVELYVQDSEQPHHSLGEYSLLKKDWTRVPVRRKANFDQDRTRAKYEKLGELIELALKSKRLKDVERVLDIIKRYRKSGLDQTGEFGPENLAFKAIRKHGLFKALWDLKQELHSKELSLANEMGEDYDPNGPPSHKKIKGQKVDPTYNVGEARSNPEQNVKAESGMKELEDIAKTIDDPENWAISMTSEPKLGINPQVGISEDTPKGVYFYPLNYVLGMIKSRRPLPWGNDYPYIQLFQYDRSGEMTEQTKVDPAKLKQALLQYCPEEVIQQAIDDPEYDGTPYWFIYDCLSRLGKSDETNVVRWNKVLRDLGFTSVFDPGEGWIAYNEPTQGVVLDPRIIKQHKTIANRKESKVVTPARIAQWLFDEIDMELTSNRIWQKYDPDGSKVRQKCKEYAAGPDFKPFIGKPFSQELENKIKSYRIGGARELSDIAMEWYKAQQQVNEAFDQPYRLKWEAGDYGDVDAYAKLDDGTYLSIMFNKGYNQDKEEAWNVEFFRNNSQEVTGEGDQQRVFATVLSAIQKFIKKYKPNKVIFSASKEVDDGQKSQSRARLYDSLVQRYAKAWGFRAFRADAGNKVIYELSKIKKDVAEDSSNNIPTIGINVRSDGDIDYASLIVDGKKKYESRKTDSLRPYVGKTVGIVRTGNGPAVAIGQVTIGEPIVVDAEKFNRLRKQHLVPQGSKFDIDSDGTKYLYPMINPVRWDNEKPIKNKGIVSRKMQEQGVAEDYKKVEGGWHHYGLGFGGRREGIQPLPRYNQFTTMNRHKEGTASDIYHYMRFLSSKDFMQDVDITGEEIANALAKLGGTNSKTELQNFNEEHNLQLNSWNRLWDFVVKKRTDDHRSEMLRLESASGYIPSNKEKNDPRFKTALTVDVKPDSIMKNAKAFGNKVSRAGIPPQAKTNGKV
jgi:predicted transcriptional regulator